MDSRLNWITKYNKENNDEYKNYIFSGQYLAIYRPDHPKSRKDGYVYIHQLQAEKKLGRSLTEQEWVHHIDKNKSNNDINNLMIFRTIADHTAFHCGASIYKVNDVWISNMKSLKISNSRKCICPVCQKNYKDTNATMCLSCYSQEKSKSIPNKEVLLNLILKYPLTKIGKIFNVSDNAIRKWCKKYDLPFKSEDVKQYKNSLDLKI